MIRVLQVGMVISYITQFVSQELQSMTARITNALQENTLSNDIGAVVFGATVVDAREAAEVHIHNDILRLTGYYLTNFCREMQTLPTPQKVILMPSRTVFRLQSE